MMGADDCNSVCCLKRMIQPNEAVGCGIFWVVARVALVQMLKAAGMAGKDPNHI